MLLAPLHDFNILSGVTGSGKSFGINLRVYADFVSDPPNSVSILSGNTLESLYDNVITPLLDIDRDVNDISYQYHMGRPRLICHRNGAQAVCIGASNEGAEKRLQGKPKVRRWYADEVVKQPKSFIDQALSRLRYEDKGKMVIGKAIWTCNPDNPLHFIKTEYIDNPDIDVWNTYWGFWDNPLMTKEFIQKQESRYSGVFKERMIYGKWTAAEGQIYDQFRLDLHVTDKKPPNIQEYVLGIDWGYSNPLAILLCAIDYDGRYWIQDEFYQTGQLIDETLKAQLISKGWFDLPHYTKKPSYAYCDTENPENMARFYKLTNITTIGAKKDVVAGIQSVQNAMTDGKNGPRLFIHPRCKNTIRETSGYVWQQGKMGAKDEPLKQMDHTQDSLRYIVHTRETGRVRVLKQSPFKIRKTVI